MGLNKSKSSAPLWSGFLDFDPDLDFFLTKWSGFGLDFAQKSGFGPDFAQKSGFGQDFAKVRI